MARLCGLQVQLNYEPIHNGAEPRSKAATVKARMKTIRGTGGAVSEQTFILKGRDGKSTTKTTVQSYFENSKSSTKCRLNV
jgi:hypothetical protein